jgi:hypothetical protein
MSSNINYNSFSTNKGPELSFFESNSLVAKFAFLLIVIFGFVIILRMGIFLTGYIFSPPRSPHLIDGMVDAKNAIIFPQGPNDAQAVTITRSLDQNNGIEFTWSVWIFVNTFYYLDGQYKHIFYKGNSNLAENGLNFPNNAPGLYLAPNSNDLVLIMNTFDVINEEITVNDIPANKWINIIIRCKNKTLDVYVNGTIARSLQLSSVPKQNYGDVFVAMNGGFDGYISNLWYYNYALSTSAIQNIVSYGPNTKMSDYNNTVSTKQTDYLSLKWYVDDNRYKMN